MSDIAWAAVISGGAAIVAGLLAGYLGVVLGRRNEHRQWLRDRRSDVYAQVLRVNGRIQLDLLDVADLKGEEFRRFLEEHGSQRRQELNNALADLSLYGSARVRVLADEARTEVTTPPILVTHGGSGTKWDALVVAIRDDLGVVD